MIIKTARIALCASLLVGAQLVSAPLVQAQDANANLAEFSALLDQIENLKLDTAQRELMLETQKKTIAVLQSQITQVPETTASVKGIATKMAAEIEKQIEQDIPFRREERYARLGQLLNVINDPQARPNEMYRRALSVLDTEVNYGNSVSAYIGDNPISPGRRLAACRENIESVTCNLSKETKKKLDGGANINGVEGDIKDISDEIKDGNYVHFGRMAFLYLDLDSREGYRWNQDSKEWDKLNSGDIINVRRAVRIARGESAPGVVTAPIKVQAAK